jgi:hypothetical protein
MNNSVTKAIQLLEELSRIKSADITGRARCQGFLDETQGREGKSNDHREIIPRLLVANLLIVYNSES